MSHIGYYFGHQGKCNYFVAGGIGGPIGGAERVREQLYRGC
jgi:hypothetical protein